MGNFIVFGSSLREEMKPYAELSLSGVRKLVRRFESLQQSFGWGIDFATFAALFRVDADAASSRSLWLCWDTDNNGVTDVLEILSGLTLISQGKFEDKLSACFDLFDFDSSASLTLEELRICIRTSLSGLCKLLGQEEPPPEEVDALSARAFAALGGGGSSIGREEFLRWVVATPTIIGTVCRFGTVNGEQTRRRYAQRMAEDKAAQKIQRAFLSMQARAASGAGAGADAGSTASARVDSLRHRDDPALGSAFDPSVHAAALRRAKAVFDSIDSDGSGSISTRELIASMDAPSASSSAAASAASSSASASAASALSSSREYLPATLSAFRAMDCDGDGHLTFPEMLRVLYPAARGRDIRAMARSVTGPDPPVDKEVVQALLIWFNKEAGKTAGAAGAAAAATATVGTMTMTLRDAVAGLRSDALFRPLVEHYAPPSRLLDTPLSFTQLLQELVGGEGPRVRERLARVMEWARAAQLLQQHALPPHLDEKRQRELETLFNLYDQDDNGCIDMNELRSHFVGLGFSAEEASRLFSRYDTDGNHRVDLDEFKNFYRSVWDTQTKMAQLAKAPSASAPR